MVSKGSRDGGDEGSDGDGKVLTFPALRPDKKREKRLEAMSAKEKKIFLETELQAKEEVYAASKKVLDLETKINDARERFNRKIGKATKQLKESIEATHNGSPQQKAAILDRVIVDFRAREELEQEKKDKLDPLLDELRNWTKRRRTAVEGIDQLALNYSDG